ncbi:MAG: DUF4760 domain-containing protein [Pseudomonadota bacterium]
MDLLVAAGEYIALHPFLLTAVLALILAIFGYINNQRRQRRTQTLDLMLEFSRNEHLTRMARLIDARFLSGETITNDSLDEQEAEDISTLMVSLEYLAFAYNTGTVDRNSVDRMLVHRIIKTYWVTRPLILERRKAASLYFCEIEAVATRGSRAQEYKRQFKSAQK